jgi:hypothetical protein
LNLAASNPLALFAPIEFDHEGNLNSTVLAHAWAGATALMGSVHLFYDLELQKNRMEAQTFADMNEDTEEPFEIPIEGGEPLPPWTNLLATEKQDSKAFTFSQRLGEDVKDRCIADIVFECRKYLKHEALDMTVNRWTMAFKDAMTPTSALSPTVIGCKLRGFGIDLALTDPNILFLHHEWISDTHLRPQLHANTWLGAV